MLRSLAVSLLGTVVAAGIWFAGQPSANATTPVNKATSTDGKEMFATFCTPCHGVDGRGHGPAVAAQKAPPIDLTVLSKNNHGKFPEAHVVHVLKYGAEVPSHTSVEMPVWGPILGKINPKDPNDGTVRINNLSRFLQTIQIK
jgi:mono/diheme cytochrome c family protein